MRATLIAALLPGAVIVVLVPLLVREGRETDRALLQISERDSELREASSDLQQALAEISQLKMALQSLEQERGDLQTTFSALNDQHRNLSETHRALQSTAQDLSSIVATLEDERDALRESNSGLRLENETLEQTVRSLEQTVQQSSDMFMKLEAERDLMTAAMHSIEQELDSLKVSYSELGDEHDSLRETHRALQSTAQGLSSSVATLEDERDSLRDSNSGLRLENKTLEQMVEQSSDMVMKLEAERDLMTAAMDSIEQELDSLKVSYSELGAEHDSLEVSYSDQSEENDELKEAVQRLEGEIDRLEGENQAFTTAYESVESLEEQANGLRAVIGTLEDERKALIVKSAEMFPVCSGSMEPKITCLDTVVVLQNFRPEDITLGAIIAYHPPTPTTGDDQESDGGRQTPILHRVIDIKVEDGVHYFWPKGDAEEEADGFWVAESSVLGYATALLQGTRPQNAALRDRVNGAKDMYIATRAKMLETRGIYDEAATMYCGSIEAASSCNAAPADFRRVLDAYESFAIAWDAYLTAVCQYHEAYYHGIHESEPKEGGSFAPYIAPRNCSQGG